MAKGGISKKKAAPSVHSRAARRATSPGIDTDKSLKNARPPTESVNYRPAVLAAHQGGGVSKKSGKRGRKSVLSARARRRHEKGLDMAAAVVDRTAQKVQKSRTQAKTIQSRKKAWEEVNGGVSAGKTGGTNMFAGLEGADGEGEEDDQFEDTDEEMEGEEEDEGQTTASAANGTGAATVNASTAAVDEDEIL